MKEEEENVEMLLSQKAATSDVTLSKSSHLLCTHGSGLRPVQQRFFCLAHLFLHMLVPLCPLQKV